MKSIALFVVILAALTSIGCGPSEKELATSRASLLALATQHIEAPGYHPASPEELAAFQKAHWPNEPDERWYGGAGGYGVSHQHPCLFGFFLGTRPHVSRYSCTIGLVEDDFLSYEREHSIPKFDYTTGAPDPRTTTEEEALVCEIKGGGVYDAEIIVFGQVADAGQRTVVCK